MKYMAIIDADEKPVSCEFFGRNGNFRPCSLGTTTDIKAIEQEPKTGHWIKNSPFTKPYCSECGASCFGLHGFDYTISPYCHNCGAKMESEDE